MDCKHRATTERSPRLSETLLNLGRQVLAVQPFSRLVDCEMVSFERGKAELALPISDKVRQQYGFVHGGVLSYLADNSLTFAAGSVLGDSVLTVEQKINYLRPAKGNGRFVASTVVVDAGKNQAVCRCDIFLDNGKERVLCAAAQGTIRKI